MPPFAALPRTAVHAWCPRLDSHPHSHSHSSSPGPLLVTGTVSGALDDSFSTDSQLELWQPFQPDQGGLQHPVAIVQWNARFNSLAWGKHAGTESAHTPLGVIAAGLDDGGVALWNPDCLLNRSATGRDPLIASLDSPHRGPVRGLDFSPAQSNLLASGATNGEVRFSAPSSPLTRFPRGSLEREKQCEPSLTRRPLSLLSLALPGPAPHPWDL